MRLSEEQVAAIVVVAKLELPQPTSAIMRDLADKLAKGSSRNITCKRLSGIDSNAWIAHVVDCLVRMGSDESCGIARIFVDGRLALQPNLLRARADKEDVLLNSLFLEYAATAPNYPYCLESKDWFLKAMSGDGFKVRMIRGGRPSRAWMIDLFKVPNGEQLFSKLRQILPLRLSDSGKN